MTEPVTVKMPAWPTPGWVVGEIRVYLLAILISGGGFLLAAGLFYSTKWAIFTVGLAMGSLAALALMRIAGDAVRRYGDAFAKVWTVRDLDEFHDDLQKLLDSAEKIAAENEALRSKIARLRQRSMRRQS